MALAWLRLFSPCLCFNNKDLSSPPTSRFQRPQTEKVNKKKMKKKKKKNTHPLSLSLSLSLVCSKCVYEFISSSSRIIIIIGHTAAVECCVSASAVEWECCLPEPVDKSFICMFCLSLYCTSFLIFRLLSSPVRSRLLRGSRGRLS